MPTDTPPTYSPPSMPPSPTCLRHLSVDCLWNLSLQEHRARRLDGCGGLGAQLPGRGVGAAVQDDSIVACGSVDSSRVVI